MIMVSCHVMLAKNNTLSYCAFIDCNCISILEPFDCRLSDIQILCFSVIRYVLAETFQHQMESTRQTAHHSLVGYTLANECE